MLERPNIPLLCGLGFSPLSIAVLLALFGSVLIFEFHQATTCGDFVLCTRFSKVMDFNIEK
jgi:hypothetical protein